MLSPLYGQLSPLRVPTSMRFISNDADVVAYVLAVESADGDRLEDGVISAYESFILGCKSDGIWSALKASCILAGARTLPGALVPLVGTAPTNANFVTADYNRETGLKGNGSTKRLNSNYFFPTSNRNNAHAACFASEITGAAKFLLGDAETNGSSSLTNISVWSSASQSFSRLNCGQQTTTTLAPTSGTFAVSRSAFPSFNFRRNGATQIVSVNSAVPLQVAMSFFSRTNNPASFFDGRISFYSVGENLDLALLDPRVSTLMTDLAAAI
jgi:hypothetical protein